MFKLDQRKVSFRKAGSGSITPSLTLSKVALEKLGVTIEDPFIVVEYYEEQIIIKKLKK